MQSQKISMKSPLNRAGFFDFRLKVLFKHFKKTTAAALVITFSWGQLLYAADPRQMLLLAKKSFELEDERRVGGTSEAEAELSQSQVEQLMEEKNELETLHEKQQFSLTTANGDVLKYVDGKLRKVERPDGTALKNIQLDAQGNITDADIKLADGSVQVYEDGKIIGYRLPNGAQAMYENGVLTKVISKSGMQTTYTYIKDVQNSITEIILENADAKAWYTPGGIIKQTYSKTTFATTIFDEGLIKRIVKQNGTSLVFEEDAIGVNKKLYLVEQSDALNPFEYAIYRQDNSLKEIRDNEGRKLEFDEAGMLVKVTDADGRETDFDITSSSLSTLVNSQISQDNGITSAYDADGRLSAVTVGDMTLHYKEDEDTVDFIEKEDGTEIHDILFDEDGELLNALIITAEGEERLYEDRKLVSLKKPDLTRIFYEDEEVTRLITAQNVSYSFEYTATGIEAVIDMAAPDAETAIRMEYDSEFNLKKIIRQNQEVLNYLNNDLIRIDRPENSPQVFNYTKDAQGNILSYTVTQGDTVTYYDADSQVTKAIIHETEENEHEIEVNYQYGKIRQVKKDNVVTFQYTYTFDAAGNEITNIKDLEEHTFKKYKESLLLSSLDEVNNVLSEYSYYADDKVSRVVVTRLGRPIHTYDYSYNSDETIVADEEGVIRFYNEDQKLIALERDNIKYAYSYHLNEDEEEIVQEKVIQKKLANGAKAFYDESGQVERIELADGTTVEDLTLDDARNLIKATHVRADGVKVVFNATEVLEEIYTDGSHLYYSNGQIIKAVDANGVEAFYTYEVNGQGVVTAVWVKKEGVDYKYDPDGDLLGAAIPEAAREGGARFYDNSLSRHVIAALGDARITDAKAKEGKYSAFFDGNGDHLKIADTGDAFDFGTGDFEIELWVNFNQIQGDNVILDRDMGRSGFTLQYYNGQLGWTDNNAGRKWQSWSAQTNIWYRVKVARVSSQLHFYVDGQELGQGTSHSSNINSSSELIIGCNAGINPTFNGYVDDLKITKASTTSLHLTFDNASQSFYEFKEKKDAQGTTIGYDFDGYAATLSYNLSAQYLSTQFKSGDVGARDIEDAKALSRNINGTALLTAGAKIGTEAIRFTAPGDFLTIADSADWDLGAGDFTIDTWLKFDSFGTHNMPLSRNRNEGAGDFEWNYNSASNLMTWGANGALLKQESWTAQTNTWYHLAIVRAGGQLNFYVNGIKLGNSTADSSSISGMNGINLGADKLGNWALRGWLDEFRISSSARWTANFTPPTTAYEVDASTKLLLHFDNKVKNAVTQFAPKPAGKFLGMRDLAHQAFIQLGSKTDGGAASRFSLATPSVLGFDAIISQEYSTDGTLETQTKADGTVTLFDGNKPSTVLDKDGTVLIEYSYDAEGNPTRVYLKNARTVLPKEVLKAREKIESERVNQLLILAQQKNLATGSIQQQFADAKTQLRGQVTSLQNQFNEVSGIEAKGKKAKSQKGDALNQIGNAIADVRIALANLEAQEADAYAALDSQVLTLSNQIKAEANLAFGALSQQEVAMKKEILKQEISPIVYDYFRRILGRDPSSQEYDSWVSQVNYDSGEEGVDLPRINESLLALKGDGGHMSFEDSPSFDLTGPTWTVDTWVKLNNLSTNQTIFSQTDNITNCIKLVAHTDGSLRFTVNRAASWVVYFTTSTNTMTAGSWKHIALVRVSGTYKLFLNGTLKLSVSDADNAADYSGEFKVGLGPNNNESLNGDFAEFRISKGTARWTNSFATPPARGYKWDSNTTFLLGTKKANQARLVNNSPSLALDGQGDFVTTPDSADFDLSSGNWTIDTWLKTTSFSTPQTIFCHKNDGSNYSKLVITTSGSINFLVKYAGGTVVNFSTPANTISLNDWYHVALVRNGTAYLLYVNGKQLLSVTDTDKPANYTGTFKLGVSTSDVDFFNGYIDEFRVSKGIARWTAAEFTRPSPLTRHTTDSYTMLLLRGLIDQSGKNKIFTANGNAKIDPNKTYFRGADLTTAVQTAIQALPELAQRQAYVASVKSTVAQKVSAYLAMNDAAKLAYAQSLGLSQNDLIALSSADANKITTWLDSRSLHFGQSAFLSLESMLDQKGISYAREDIAWKSIVIDILSGIITPLDDGDLVISVFALNKVASLYGLTLTGANLSWADLQALLPTTGNATSTRIIAHINGNHFVIITGITANSITYIDPGIGKDKQNEVLTVTKDGFLKVWKGNTTLETSKVQTLANYQPKLLSAESAKKIRGAFWGSLLNLIGSVLNIIVPGLGVPFQIAALIVSIFEGDWISGISAAVSLAFGGFDFLGDFFKGAAQGFVNTLGTFGEVLSTVGQFFHTVYVNVTGFFGTIFSAIPGVTTTLAANVATQLVNKAIFIGVNFGVSRGLETLGVSPEVSSFVASLAAGAVIAGLSPETGNLSGRTVSQAQLIQASLTQTIMLNQIGSLGLELGLDSAFTDIIGFTLGAIQGDIITNPATTLEIAFSNIRDKIANNLALYGIDKLGQSVGLSPLFSSLIGIPISSALAATINQIQYTGQMNSADQANLSIDIEGYYDSAQYRNVDAPALGTPERVWWDSFVQFTKNNILVMIQSQISAYYASQSQFNGINLPPITTTLPPLPDGAIAENYQDIFTGQIKQGYRINTSQSGYMIHDRITGFTVKRVSGGVVEVGVFQYRMIKKADGSYALDLRNPKHLSKGNIYYESPQGGEINFKMVENNVQEIRIDVESQDVVLDPGATRDATNKVINGIVRILSLGLTLIVTNGQVSSSSQGNNLTSSELNKRIKRVFIFGNGFENERREEDVPDPLMESYVSNLEAQEIINPGKKLMFYLYEITRLVGNAVDWLTDFEPVAASILFHIMEGPFASTIDMVSFYLSLLNNPTIPQSMRTYIQGLNNYLAENWGINNSLVQEVIRELDQKGPIEDGIAFVHSGATAPLLYALQAKPYDINTMLIYEGPCPNYRETIANPNLKRIIHVRGTGTAADGDSIVPFLGWADFQGGVENINIQITGAFHNDFSYNPNDYADHTFWDEKKARRQLINRRTNLFMRDLYGATLADQSEPGRLSGFLDALESLGAASFENGIWTVNPDRLRDEVNL